MYTPRFFERYRVARELGMDIARQAQFANMTKEQDAFMREMLARRMRIIAASEVPISTITAKTIFGELVEIACRCETPEELQAAREEDAAQHHIRLAYSYADHYTAGKQEAA